MMCIAQHDLFQVIPELEADIRPPPFQEAVERLYKRNAWVGPAGELLMPCDVARPGLCRGVPGLGSTSLEIHAARFL